MYLLYEEGESESHSKLTGAQEIRHQTFYPENHEVWRFRTRDVLSA